ncbi:S-layer homology domain-containing protein [Sporomusa sp.]|uniref:S-layer homology domain-containing protein n=1 Tax=Sporomusa sp. TaxID=2078658 RepID=UPI002C248B32|nr:S-layer homology domain-containing protein [Sporomusa sp.]HWR07184.1 S-layer homology domain-containing protein [Sporomusa sp.]
MKKMITTMLAMVFGLSITGTAFAANPFADVPVKHWSYDAVQKLADAGIITGSGDGSFQGERTVSRYEMAAIVSNAIAHADKANEADKALIEKLAAEYQSELEGFNVRLTKVEKKQDNITFSGSVRERYEWTKVSDGSDPTTVKTRLRLTMNAPLTDDLAFTGRFATESKSVDARTGKGAFGDAFLDLAYLSGKLFNGVNFAAGRIPWVIGKGITVDVPHDWDGAKISFGNKVKVNAGAAQYHADNWKSPNYAFVDMAYNITSDLDMTLAWFTDRKEDQYRTKAIGVGYTFDKFSIKAEYASNGAQYAKDSNGGSEAKALNTALKYLGADLSKEHTYGVWVGYRKADKNFDPLWWSTPEATDVAGPKAVLNDTKGFEYGVEYTVFKNGLLLLQYNDVKDKNGKSSDGRRNFIGSLWYFF